MSEAASESVGRVTVRSTARNEDQKCCYRAINSEGMRVLWEVTSACNLSCDFCLVEIKRRPVPLEQAIGMADQLIDAGVEKFMISGGEPLIYPGIEGLLRHLVSRGVLVKLLTNGTIHHEGVFKLVRSEPSIEVSISLQTVEETRADEVFGRAGSFRKIEQSMAMLPRQRMNIIAVYNQMTRDQIEPLIDWVGDAGIPCLSIINVFQAPESVARFRDDCLIYRTGPRDVEELFQLIARKREQYAGQMVIRTTQFTGPGGETCGAGRSMLYIDSDGTLLPCTLTDNNVYRDAVSGLTVTEALAWYRDNLPALPASSCLNLLRSSADPIAETAPGAQVAG